MDAREFFAAPTPGGTNGFVPMPEDVTGDGEINVSDPLRVISAERKLRRMP